MSFFKESVLFMSLFQSSTSTQVCIDSNLLLTLIYLQMSSVTTSLLYVLCRGWVFRWKCCHGCKQVSSCLKENTAPPVLRQDVVMLRKTEEAKQLPATTGHVWPRLATLIERKKLHDETEISAFISSSNLHKHIEISFTQCRWNCVWLTNASHGSFLC